MPSATDPRSLFRLNMNEDLAYLSDPELQLIEKLKDEDVEVRRKAAAECWKKSEPENAAYRQFQSVSVYENKAKTSTRLLEALVAGCADDDFKVRYDCASAMGRYGKTDRFTVDPFVARLAQKLSNNETSAALKCKMAESLSRIGTPASMYSKALGDNLEHEDWQVRLACVEGLDRLGPEIKKHYS